MKLIAYRINSPAVEIVPAPLVRQWMDDTPHKYAYRCLPLNIANQYGWQLLCPTEFTASWNGGKEQTDIWLASAEQRVPAVSHFGSGILTFPVPYLFRSDPGISLYVSGPINQPKSDIVPLTGIVETDTAHQTFTMNWLFVRPTTVKFQQGEPFMQLFPIGRDTVETVMPEIRPLSENAELMAQYQEWSEARGTFIRDLGVVGSEAQQQGWQRHYFQNAAKTKIKVKEFG